MFGYAYDAAGNLLADGLGGTFTWDSQGRLAAAGGVSYTYDPLGQRVGKQGVGLTDTVYFGGRPIARYSAGQWTDLIYGPTGLLAEVPGTQTGAPVYRVTDHLGSNVGSLTATGAFINPMDYTPFGQVFSGATNDPYGFTGYEHDAESGLEFASARHFSSTAGRFMSPDPYLGSIDLTNPQTFNRYTYAMNNPLSFIDPSGLDCVGASNTTSYNPSDGSIGAYTDTSTPSGCTAAGGYWEANGTTTLSSPTSPITCSDNGTCSMSTGVANISLSALQFSLANAWGLPGLDLTNSGSAGGGGAGAPSKSGCKASSGPSSIVTFTATKDLTEVGAEIGSLFGPEGTIIGAVVGSQFGVGGNISYVNSTHSLYIGPTAVFAPLQVGGGGGFSLSYTNVPASQNANAIANGTSYGVAFQPNILFGSVVSKSPGSGPPVVGYQVGTRSPVGFSASHNFCLWNCGC